MIETGESLQRHDEPSPHVPQCWYACHTAIYGLAQRLRFMDDQDGLEMLVRHAARHYFADSLNADDDIGALAVASLALWPRAWPIPPALMASGFAWC